MVKYYKAILLGLLGMGVVVAAFLLPKDSQAGEPTAMEYGTSYCLPDGSGMRAYERPYPQGGKVPLFSVVYAGDLNPNNVAYCEVR